LKTKQKNSRQWLLLSPGPGTFYFLLAEIAAIKIEFNTFGQIQYLLDFLAKNKTTAVGLIINLEPFILPDQNCRQIISVRQLKSILRQIVNHLSDDRQQNVPVIFLTPKVNLDLYRIIKQIKLWWVEKKLMVTKRKKFSFLLLNYTNIKLIRRLKNFCRSWAINY